MPPQLNNTYIMDTETKERVLARQTIAFQKHLQQGSGAAQKVLNDLQCRNKALQRERPEIQRRLDNPTRKSRKKTVREKNAADRKKLEEVDREFALTRQQGGGATVTSTLVKVCKKIEKLAQQNPTSTAELNEVSLIYSRNPSLVSHTRLLYLSHRTSPPSPPL